MKQTFIESEFQDEALGNFSNIDKKEHTFILELYGIEHHELHDLMMTGEYILIFSLNNKAEFYIL